MMTYKERKIITQVKDKSEGIAGNINPSFDLYYPPTTETEWAKHNNICNLFQAIIIIVHCVKIRFLKQDTENTCYTMNDE